MVLSPLFPRPACPSSAGGAIIRSVSSSAAAFYIPSFGGASDSSARGPFSARNDPESFTSSHEVDDSWAPLPRRPHNIISRQNKLTKGLRDLRRGTDVSLARTSETIFVKGGPWLLEEYVAGAGGGAPGASSTAPRFRTLLASTKNQRATELVGHYPNKVLSQVPVELLHYICYDDFEHYDDRYRARQAAIQLENQEKTIVLDDQTENLVVDEAPFGSGKDNGKSDPALLQVNGVFQFPKEDEDDGLVVGEVERPRPLRTGLRDQKLVLVLDGVSLPDNVGLLFRCAAAHKFDSVYMVHDDYLVEGSSVRGR